MSDSYPNPLDLLIQKEYNKRCITRGMWRSLASALALGARGRGFKSLHPDQLDCGYLHGGVPEWPKGADCKSAG